MIARAIIILLAFGVILSIPYVLRPAEEIPPADALHLVAISPHIEAIQYEFGRAFGQWHKAKYGRPVVIDWRNIGGTSELARYIESEFVAGFKLHWTRTLGKAWDSRAAAGFNDGKLDAALASQPSQAQPEDVGLAARRAFLASNVGIGIDVFFGGGSFDHDRIARRGYIVDSGLSREHPDWLAPDIIPQRLGGEVYYDKQGRWYGACLSTFGICYNRDSLERLGIHKPPTQWADLADPRYYRQIALADPTKSGSIAKAFEMIIQQQMHREVEARKAAAGDNWNPQQEQQAVAAGWLRAMQLIQRMAANSRYFSDGAGMVVTDVADGNAAAGMSIDYYTRFTAESVTGRKAGDRGQGTGDSNDRQGDTETRRRGDATADKVTRWQGDKARTAGAGGPEVASGEWRMASDGASRLVFVTPIGGTSVSADPVAMFRGAPNAEVARHFIEFVMSPAGQKLWDYRVGTPGGPVRYCLRRLPIRKDMYTPQHRQYMADPVEDPYVIAARMTYRADWTAGLFNFLRPYIQSMAIEPHAELQAAWRAVIQAGGPAANTGAVRTLGAMPLTYEQAAGQNVADPFSRMALTRQWAVFFKEHYERAALQAAVTSEATTATTATD
jgi:iron(III) transport system substrate-binding protein